MSCKKKTYLTKAEAVEKIRAIRAEGGDHKKPIRSYRCPKCDNFHLTSMAKKKKQYLDVKIAQGKLQKIVDFWAKKKGWQ
jgi:hypothetical protein